MRRPYTVAQLHMLSNLTDSDLVKAKKVVFSLRIIEKCRVSADDITYNNAIFRTVVKIICAANFTPIVTPTLEMDPFAFE